MKTVSKILIAVVLMSTIYPSSSWAQQWRDAQGIATVSGSSGNPPIVAFTAPTGQLGYTNGRLTHLRVPRQGLTKSIPALTGWTGQCSYTNMDDGSPGIQSCTTLNKTEDPINGFYVFTIP
jgi:hypothetical protein